MGSYAPVNSSNARLCFTTASRNWRASPFQGTNQEFSIGNCCSFLPIWFQIFAPGSFSYNNSRETPEIWEFPEFQEFPVLQVFPKFTPAGNSNFLSVPISDFQSIFCIKKLISFDFPAQNSFILRY